MLVSIAILVFIYSGFILLNVLRTEQKRKNLKKGDVCNVYLGENKISGYVLKVNSGVDVWVMNKVINFSRKQIYA